MPTVNHIKFLKSKEKKLLSFCKDLVKINSVYGNETEVAKRIKKELSDYGISSRIFGKNKQSQSIVADIGKGSKTIMLNGHMDTVPFGDLSKWKHKPLSTKVIGDKLYGRGTYDMKGADAALTYAAIALAQDKKNLPGKVRLLFCWGEESGKFLGIRECMKNGIGADAVIIGEPTPKQTIYLGTKGAYRFTVVVRGETGHTGQHKNRPTNATTHMAKILLALEKTKFTLKKHPMFPNPVITPGTILNGGTGTNVFPSKVEAYVDCRLSFGQSKASAIKDINRALKTVKTPKDIKVEIKTPVYVPPTFTEKSEPIFKAVRNSIKEEYKKPVKAGIAPYSSDYNFMFPKIPGVLHGPLGDKIHCENEYVSIKSMFACSRVYANSCLEFLGS